MGFAVRCFLCLYQHIFLRSRPQLWYMKGHISAALVFGVELRRIRILPAGFLIDYEAGSVPYSKSAIILLAGAAANLLAAAVTALFCGTKAYFFAVNIGLAFFNLLPMYGLDGGGVLLHTCLIY